MSDRAYIARAGRADWQTPPEVLIPVIATLGAIDLDPCSSPNPDDWFAETNLNPAQGIDGLAADWGYTDRGRDRRVFVNPPFGSLSDWTTKARAEVETNPVEIVFLLPARTDTAYWHRDISTASLVCLLRGRLKFVGATSSCPFPTAIAYWGHRPALFHAAFAPKGMVFAP